MNQNRFALALAAIVFSFALTDVATAYPSTARSGSTSVTGQYRPLDLDLTLVETPDVGLNIDFDGFDPIAFSFTGRYSGTFNSSEDAEYTASGLAGTWTLKLGFDVGDNSVGFTLDTTQWVESGKLTWNQQENFGGFDFGTLTYESGFQLQQGELPQDGRDTPQVGDVFRLKTTAAGPVMEVTVLDKELKSFQLTLLRDLAHLGPFNANRCDNPDLNCEGDLEIPRVNETCLRTPFSCGSIPKKEFYASSAPEPTTLALFGLGLAGLGWRARARR